MVPYLIFLGWSLTYTLVILFTVRVVPKFSYTDEKTMELGKPRSRSEIFPSIPVLTVLSFIPILNFAYVCVFSVIVLVVLAEKFFSRLFRWIRFLSEKMLGVSDEE